ncbi:conserved hypothetical protein [Sphingobacterium sp. PM2-P1-29]|nr:conserved hypothetical protein [Sphingobacterium sp. PM2-P1-29]
MNIDLTEAKVYVGTYKKYSEGSIFGKWLSLNDYDSIDDFYAECKELHKDEDDPELMFQDYENIPEGLISECCISDNLFEILNALSEMDDDLKEPFFIWCNNGHHSLAESDIDDLMASYENEYVGKYDDEEDYAFELVAERHDLNDFALQYFDYESYAKDLFCGDYWFSDGHVFVSR